MARRGRQRLKYAFDVGSDEFVTAVNDAAEALCLDVEDGMAERMRSAGERAVALLAERSRKRTGVYAKSWGADAVVTPYGLTVVVHQRKKPGLTHLLEKGHAKRGGGRVSGDGVIVSVADEAAGHLLEGYE